MAAGKGSLASVASLDENTQHARSDLIWIKALVEYNGSFVALALILQSAFFAGGGAITGVTRRLFILLILGGLPRGFRTASSGASAWLIPQNQIAQRMHSEV